MSRTEILLEKLIDMQRVSLGQNPSTHLKGSGSLQGNWKAFLVIEDVTISALEENGQAVGEMTGVVLPTGFIYLASSITTIGISAGHIKLYKNRIDG